MSQQLARRLTPAQKRRHEKRVANWQKCQQPETPRPRAVRQRQSMLKRLRRFARAKSHDFLAAIVARREAIAAKLGSPRCPFVNVARNIAGDVVEKNQKRLAILQPCAGKMRPVPMAKDQERQHWRCQACGRTWDQTGEARRGFGGWIEVYA